MFEIRRSGRHHTTEINFFWILTVVNILCSCLANGALLPNANKSNSSLPSANNGNSLKKITDSYGNPIEYSKPIDTPDGRKVISAHGVQFELPGYASGITDIKKPTDDLLPPFVGESNVTNDDATNWDKDRNKENIDITTAGKSIDDSSLMVERVIPKFNSLNHHQIHKAFSQQQKLQQKQQQQEQRSSVSLELVDSLETNASEKSNNKILSRSTFDHQTQSQHHSSSLHVPFESISSLGRSISSGHNEFINTNRSSSNNKNSLNLSLTDLFIINKIASKYPKHLPTTVDPNEIVAKQLKWENMAASTTTESSIEIENAEIIEITSTSTQEPDGTTEISTTTIADPPTDESTLFDGIPAYLADYNDTKVGGGVPYSGQNDSGKTKVLTWDLIPPNDMEPPLYTSESSPAKSTVPMPQKNEDGKIIRISLTPGQSYGVNNRPIFTTPTATPNYVISTTEKLIPTTSEPQNTNTTVSENSQLSTDDEYLMLPGGNSNTVPPWLADYTDPYVSGAVTYVAPTTNHHNINNIDHTLHNDVLPPLDKFTTINLPDQPDAQQETSTTSMATSTYSPITGAIDPLNFKGQTQQTQKPTTNSEISATHKYGLETKPSTYSNNLHTIFTTTIPTTNSASTLHSTTQESIKITQSPLVHEQHFTTVSVEENVAASETVPSFGENDFHNFLTTLSSSPANHNVPIDNSKDPATTFQPYPVTDLLPPKEEDEVEEEFRNPFDSATIPPWLKDYKDPLVGPGVPFVYKRSNKPIQPIVTGLLPSFEDSKIPNIFSKPGTLFDFGFKSNPFLAKIRPVPVSSPLPQQTNTNPFLQPPQPSSHVVTESSKILVPSAQVPSLNAGEVSQHIPNENNNDFPAPFDQKSINQRRAFPQNVFSKSDDGKVLSNRPLQTSQQGQNNFNSFKLPFVEPGSPFRPTTSSLAKGFKAAPTPTSSIADGKYTGGFGGAPGVLGSQAKPGFAIQSDGTIRDPDHTYRPPQGGSAFTPSDVANPKPIVSNVAPVITSTNAAKGSKYTGRFGGPPGILVPFDNAGR